MHQPPDPKPTSARRNWACTLGYTATAGYLVLAIVTLAWGVFKRFHIPQAPIVDPDIRGYLGPAMAALTGKGFIYLDGRSFPYPAFVLLILRLFGDFRALSVVQHILGAAAGALVLLAWNAMLRLVPPGGIPRQLSQWIGLGPAAIYLGSATAIHFEQEIRPESIFPFLTILNLFVSFLFIHSRFIRRHSSAVWLGGLNVFIAAPLEAINGVIAKRNTVRELVDNRWVHLFAIDTAGKISHRYRGALEWQSL